MPTHSPGGHPGRCAVSAFPIKIAAPGIAGICILYVAGVVVLFRFTNGWLPVIVPTVFQAPLAFLGAVGIEHSRLFKDVLIKLRMEEDLTSARELQMGMLPADALLQEIAAQVTAFVNDAPQHDDHIVIVVAVDKDAGEKQEEHPEAEKGKSGELQT
jgi:hypothetical protein